MLIEQPDCCEHWPQIAKDLGWFTCKAYPNMFLMPYIPGADGEMKWRVNFCPLCGKERRSLLYPTKHIEGE